MKFIYSPLYEVDLGPHPFKNEKYRLIKEQLEKSDIINKNNLIVSNEPIDWETLKTVHTEAYIEDLRLLRKSQAVLRSEMPFNKEIVNVSRIMAANSIKASELALDNNCSYHIGGGFHHAFPSHAEGFCYLNDVALAAYHINKQKGMKVAIIDCDLHQGNGTAFIFKNNDNVFTFSIHEEDIYPVKEKSSLDIGLNPFTDDNEYLEQLFSGLGKVKSFSPDFIVYVAGADPYIYDTLGYLNISMEGLKKRDEMIFETFKNIPTLILLAGGYAKNFQDTVRIHVNTAEKARNLCQ